MSNQNPTASTETPPASTGAPPASTGTPPANGGRPPAGSEKPAGNLTFDKNLVRPVKAEPLEGHTVVVLERVGESGEKFHKLLEPGDERPRPGLISTLLKKPTQYVAYAVDASRHRLLKFSAPVSMAERAHTFELHFSLWYRAADPQLVVATRDHDPLELVRSKVAEVITGAVSELPWASVWESFRPAGEAVVARCMATLRGFARDYGIAINSIELREEFSDTTRASAIGVQQIRDETRVKLEQLQAERELRNHEIALAQANAEIDRAARMAKAREELEDVVVRGTIEKVGAEIGEATSLPEVNDVLVKLPPMSLFGAPPQNGTGAPPLMGIAGGHAPAALPPGASTPVPAAPADGVSAVLADLVARTEFRPEIQARQVRGALLHVLAAVVADDSSQGSGELAAWSARAHLAIEGVGSLSLGQADALQALADPDHLRGRLYPSTLQP